MKLAINEQIIEMKRRKSNRNKSFVFDTVFVIGVNIDKERHIDNKNDVAKTQIWEKRCGKIRTSAINVKYNPINTIKAHRGTI